MWTSPSVPGRAQPAPAVRPSDHLVSTKWQPSLTVPTTGWPAGAYLLLMTATNGKQKYVPITIRSDSTRDAVVIVDAVNTYQAYNEWGGYSLYNGPDKSFGSRAHRVTFDRPYDGNGARTLVQSELPLIQLAERSGVRLAYLTSVDVATDPNALAGARGMVSLGHDEYSTVAMRDAVTKARDTGTNLAFLGANAGYWRVRYEPSPLGADRVVVGYKDASLDPLENRPDTTAKWRSKPYPRPENSLTGMLYECFPAVGSFTVRDPGFLLYAGTRATRGSAYPGLTATEVDRAYPIAGTPKNLQVVAHSPVTCGPSIHTFSDATYYTAPSGAGVFDVGSMNWVPALHGPNSKHSLDATGVAFARTVTLNLLRGMAAGPLGHTHPAVGDLTRWVPRRPHPPDQADRSAEPALGEPRLFAHASTMIRARERLVGAQGGPGQDREGSAALPRELSGVVGDGELGQDERVSPSERAAGGRARTAARCWTALWSWERRAGCRSAGG